MVVVANSATAAREACRIPATGKRGSKSRSSRAKPEKGCAVGSGQMTGFFKAPKKKGRPKGAAGRKERAKRAREDSNGG